MRIPQSWDDTRIVFEEPLLSIFKHRYAITKRDDIKTMPLRPYTRGDHLQNIIAQISSDENGAKAVQVWITHAAQMTIKRRLTGEVHVSSSHFVIFLNFFWAFYLRRSLSEAQQILDDSPCQKLLTALYEGTKSETKEATNISTSHVSHKRVYNDRDSRHKSIVKKENDDLALHLDLLPTPRRRAPVLTPNQMKVTANNSRKRLPTFSDAHPAKRRAIDNDGRRADAYSASKPEIKSEAVPGGLNVSTVAIEPPGMNSDNQRRRPIASFRIKKYSNQASLPPQADLSKGSSFKARETCLQPTPTDVPVSLGLAPSETPASSGPFILNAPGRKQEASTRDKQSDVGTERKLSEAINTIGKTSVKISRPKKARFVEGRRVKSQITGTGSGPILRSKKRVVNDLSKPESTAESVGNIAPSASEHGISVCSVNSPEGNPVTEEGTTVKEEIADTCLAGFPDATTSCAEIIEGGGVERCLKIIKAEQADSTEASLQNDTSIASLTRQGSRKSRIKKNGKKQNTRSRPHSVASVAKPLRSAHESTAPGVVSEDRGPVGDMQSSPSPAVVNTILDKNGLENGNRHVDMVSPTKIEIVDQAGNASSQKNSAMTVGCDGEQAMTTSSPVLSRQSAMFEQQTLPNQTIPMDMCQDSHSGPVSLASCEALEHEDRIKCFSGAEPPFTFQPQDQEVSSMALLTDEIKQELGWDDTFLPPQGILYRFPKPPLQRLPPIWAESRQEICESFDWFRSYQGGVYFVNDVAKGYLLSAFPSSRDVFEHGGRLIISHGGGRAESLHSCHGHISSQPASDQLAHDKSVRALFNNYFHGRPLALLMDDKYALFPFDLKAKDVTYAVLGFYTIVHAWAEYQPANNELGRVVRFKFAFRWCEEQGEPWWHDKEDEKGQRGGIDHAELSSDSGYSSGQSEGDDSHIADSSVVINRKVAIMAWERKKLVEVCKSCRTHTLRIFDLAWVCLNPGCRLFWKQTDDRLLPRDVQYHPNFLTLPPPKSMPPAFGTLAPPSPQSFISEGNETTYAFSRGFHCPDCGRLSCRFKWEFWECMHCEYTVKLHYPIRNAAEFSYLSHPTNFQNNWVNPISEIISLPSATFMHDNGRGTVHTFLLPHDGAKIHHIQSGNRLSLREADNIFQEYQTQAASGELRFRRWPMRAHKCRGALLTNYFSQNSGEPYKYVGGDANTVPFSSAPQAVVNARALIQKRIKQAFDVSAEFNEVLSAAYMERQRMAFHSDNEVGLGPLVAGLSLGSPAMMHFRLNPRHDPLREKKGILLSIVLRHGDILVMDGAGVQDYYEHTVVPENFRIAATARQINAAHA